MGKRSDAKSSRVSVVPRRRVIASGVGLSTLILPTAAAAASLVEGLGGTPTVSSQNLLFHLDANSYSPGLNVGWNDLSGLGNHGALGSGVTFAAAAGSVPAHMSFDGSSSALVAVEDGAVITGSSPTAYTKLIWFRRDQFTRFDNLISFKSTGTEAQHFLFFNPDDDHLLLTAGNGTSFSRITTSLPIDTAAWTFAAVRFSTSGGFNLYVNRNDRGWSGAGLTATSPYNPAIDALTGGLAFTVGFYDDPAAIQGDIATALAYDVDIGDAQVKAYYAATVDRFYPAD